MEVESELCRIIISETTDEQIIVLKDCGSPRSFSIGIGIVEAFAIDRGIKNIKMPRPMTHDLLHSVIESFGGVLERVVVTDLIHHTYYAVLRISLNGRLIEVDARPSDAIALAVSAGVPIFVNERVFKKVGQ
ncbi:MAG TPA: bifunctional nuclease family protein [Sedimentisphaerales bacterium]|nr:bifunctional nuclease family protein [Sedimentisphaerales bacterium]